MNQLSLGVLAGGQGSRLGFRDKGMISVGGRLLIDALVDVKIVASENVLINCQQNHWLYQHYAGTLVCDASPNQGPVAGILALLATCNTDLLAIAACDHWQTPSNWIELLLEQVGPQEVGVYATDDQRHTAFCLIKLSAASDISAWYDSGGRSLRSLFEAFSMRGVPIKGISRDIDIPSDYRF